MATFTLKLVILSVSFLAVSCGSSSENSDVSSAQPIKVKVTGDQATTIINNYRLVAKYDGGRKLNFSCIAKQPSKNRAWGYSGCYWDAKAAQKNSGTPLTPYNVKEPYYMIAAISDAIPQQAKLAIPAELAKLGYTTLIIVKNFSCNRLPKTTSTGNDQCEFEVGRP